MKLSILIPTYNRCNDLRKNLELLCTYIKDDQLELDVCILVSDNASTDDTELLVQSFLSQGVSVEYFRNETNVGYSKNVISILSKAKTEWVMLLGDDDYLEPWYIKECLNRINANPNLGCLIANYIDYDTSTGQYGSLREKNCQTQYYNAGYSACIENIWRAHQVSGLCFRRNQLVDLYQNKKMNNLYPQMFFVGFNALKYDVLHFGEKCLAVSSVSQDKKDWNYGNDGLMNDICENFKNLDISYKQRAKLEADFNARQQRYLWTSTDMNLCIDNILCAKNISLFGKYYISRQILRQYRYSGKRHRIWFYVIARISLLKNLLNGRVGL